MSNTLKQNRGAHVVINRAAFRHNLDRVKAYAPKASVIAVIKADGYGHGMEVAADNLGDADEFAVNSWDDVLRLRKHGIKKRINVLSAQLSLEQLNTCSQLNVRPVFYDLSQLSAYEGISPDKKIDIWVKVDTGMGRLGVLPTQLSVVYERLSSAKGVATISLMTHLANADNVKSPVNDQQIQQIKKLAQGYLFSELSIANSAGVIGFSSAHVDQIRPGVMLYGISPIQGVSASELGLKPVMTFKSRLISVKSLPAGSAIGYGGTYSLGVDSRIGVVACGYGDGYPRHAPSGTPVVINGALVSVIGRVSMDMLTVNLGDLPASVGDDVVLWGEDNPIETVAELASTIAYELCCGILPRVERVIM